MFKTLFGAGPKTDLGQKIKEGAIIVDVRTPDEFRSGHVAGSINIPLDRIESQTAKLDKNKVIITCCRSGARSGMAVDMLKRHGFEVYNGGSWTAVNGLK
jgi:rhodanese-related sulfurtransferase